MNGQQKELNIQLFVIYLHTLYIFLKIKVEYLICFINLFKRQQKRQLNESPYFEK